MSPRERFWNKFSSWKEAQENWEEGAQASQKQNPLKILKHLPDMPGITRSTAQFLKWKSLWYLITHDKRKVFPRLIFKKPIKHFFQLLRSTLKRKSYRREEDFFFYGLKDIKAFEVKMQDPNALLVVGFSYCHKPLECPSGRFSQACIHDPDHPVCRQCFIGKVINALPEKGVIPLCIPTVHYIGEKILKVVQQNPHRTVYFLITACEMTLKMFGDWGNMSGVKGIGVRLDGRICNTLKAFVLSEEGIKPGLTVVTAPTQQKMLDLIAQLRSNASCEKA